MTSAIDPVGDCRQTTSNRRVALIVGRRREEVESKSRGSMINEGQETEGLKFGHYGSVSKGPQCPIYTS